MNITSQDGVEPANNKQVITACAFIHKEINGLEKIFLPKRAGTKKM